jgi:hypothetical protein
MMEAEPGWSGTYLHTLRTVGVADEKGTTNGTGLKGSKQESVPSRLNDSVQGLQYYHGRITEQSSLLVKVMVLEPRVIIALAHNPSHRILQIDQTSQFSTS